MKDAQGHGSDGSGSFMPKSISDARAAAALAQNHPKSDTSPVTGRLPGSGIGMSANASFSAPARGMSFSGNTAAMLMRQKMTGR
jgi:hypothetical protein